MYKFCNFLCRYYDLKPKHDTAAIRIKELEKEIESLKNNVIQQDELQKTLYLQLYAKQEKVEETVVNTRSFAVRKYPPNRSTR